MEEVDKKSHHLFYSSKEYNKQEKVSIMNPVSKDKHRFRLPEIKSTLLNGQNQNIIDAYLENDELVIVTERYEKHGESPLVIIDDVVYRSTTAKINKMNRVRRDKWSRLKHWLLSQDNQDQIDYKQLVAKMMEIEKDS